MRSLATIFFAWLSEELEINLEWPNDLIITQFSFKTVVTNDLEYKFIIIWPWYSIFHCVQVFLFSSSFFFCVALLLNEVEMLYLPSNLFDAYRPIMPVLHVTSTISCLFAFIRSRSRSFLFPHFLFLVHYQIHLKHTRKIKTWRWNVLFLRYTWMVASYYRNVFCVQHQCYIFIMYHVDVHIIHQLSDSFKFICCIY